MIERFKDIIIEISDLNKLIKILALALNNEASDTSYQYDAFMTLLMEKTETLLEHVEDFNLEILKEKLNI